MPSIHVVGDSHASNTISGWKDCKNIISHYIGSVLCYSFGNDKFKRFDIRKIKLNNNDSIIFCFGEIDCRCHIYKHITPENTYQMIIDKIISNYIEAIKMSITLCRRKLKNICIYNIVPPIHKNDRPENPDFPYLGSDEERLSYVLYFNQKLKEKCSENNWIFFDIYDKYCNDDGFLNADFSDETVHIKNGIYLQEFIDNNFK